MSKVLGVPDWLPAAFASPSRHIARLPFAELLPPFLLHNYFIHLEPTAMSLAIALLTLLQSGPNLYANSLHSGRRRSDCCSDLGDMFLCGPHLVNVIQCFETRDQEISQPLSCCDIQIEAEP